MAFIVSSLQPGECYILFVDSTSSVSLYPNWDYEKADKKIENVHYTRSGRKYSYKWALTTKVKFTVENVTSSTMAMVNTWWASNQNLLFMRQDTTDIFSCQLSNKKTPIGKFVEPYMDEYLGTIELESY